MKLGGRSLGRILASIFEGRHYAALWRSFRVYDFPFYRLSNYVLSTGNYPCDIKLHLKGNKLQARLNSHHDLLTVNEVFCREDYPVSGDEKTIIDIGSNIGISALYFLNACPESKLFLFEPNPANIETLRANMAPYPERVSIEEYAVSDSSGMLRFGVEESGRYGGLNLELERQIKVKCLDINQVLSEVLTSSNSIEILKLDTEGAEIDTINSISIEHINQIDRIYFEEGVLSRLKLLKGELFTEFTLKSKGNSHYLSRREF
ncbi:MAG: FkbM family methyltransferase [Vicingaceae bacterium]